MNIGNKIDNIVGDIMSTGISGGTLFFDKFDGELKKPENFDIIKTLFNDINLDMGINYNLIVSGGFGDIVRFFIKQKKIIFNGILIQTSGKLRATSDTKYNKDIEILYRSGDINNKEFVFVDDSYYSGRTGQILSDFLKKYNSKILKTYVIYDGNYKKSDDRISLYNYYDYHKGTKLPIHDLLSVLHTYKNIPYDSFENEIVKGNIKTVIELKKKINEFKLRNNEKPISIHSVVKESKKLKHLKIYEEYAKRKFVITTKEEFCNMNIPRYEINEDGTIHCRSITILSNAGLTKIPFKFSRADYFFGCDLNNLITLENCPDYVGGSFDCSYNSKLETLLGGPKFVKDNYYCGSCNLKDMYGFPETFYGAVNLDTGKSLFIEDNPVMDVLNIVDSDSIQKNQIRFIKLLNEYLVIRNGENIIESRLLDVLSEMGIKEFPKNLEFKNYQLI